MEKAGISRFVKNNGLTIKIILCFFSGILYSKNFKEVRINETTFLISQSSREIKMSEISWLENIFSQSHQKVYNELNIKRPVFQKIVLTDNAGTFARLTGQNWYVAGLYVPDTDLFYFQNFKSLYNQKNLRSTIEHEICHQALVLGRHSDIKDDSRFYDESFCLSVFPSFRLASVHSSVTPIGDFNFWKAVIEKKLISKNKKEVYEAYASLLAWGDYLLTQLGRDKFLSVTLTENNIHLINLFEKYIKFRKQKKD